jgi:hypothetical protein
VGDDGKIGRKDLHWIYIYRRKTQGSFFLLQLLFLSFSRGALCYSSSFLYIFGHFHILFSLFCHTIMIIFFSSCMNKKNKASIKLFLSCSHFFFSSERDVIYRIISQCSNYYWWIECFWRQKDGCSFSSSSILRALYISIMFSTKKKKKKKKKKEESFFFTHTTHVFWVFRSLLTPTHLFSYSPCFFTKRTKKRRKKDVIQLTNNSTTCNCR